MVLTKKEVINTTAYQTGKKLERLLASNPNAERLLFYLPDNLMDLPCGEFILGPFLRFIAAALKGEIKL